MKQMTLEEAVSLVNDGDTVSFGGNVLFRSPIKVVKEIIKQKKKNLHVVKTAIAYEADLLSAAGLTNKVTAGFVGYEGEYGMCKFYRKGVEEGRILAEENACYSVITALRASAYGVPFLPIRGMQGSDLIKNVGFKEIKCPYTEEKLISIKAIEPDIAFLHVQKADLDGNGSISGPLYEDHIIALASKKVILTTEEIIDGEELKNDPHKTDIPAPLVYGIVHLPNGAKPSAVSGYYDIDRQELDKFTSELNDVAALNAIGLRKE